MALVVEEAEVPNLLEISTKKAVGKAPEIDVKLPVKKRGYAPNFKHGRHAKLLTAHCNRCYLRSVEAGGSGQCEEYKADSICTVDVHLKKVADKYDTRKTEDIKSMLAVINKDLMVRAMKATFQSNLDGNYNDKSAIAEYKTLLNSLKLSKELNEDMKVTVQQTSLYDKNDDLMAMGRTLMAEGIGE